MLKAVPIASVWGQMEPCVRATGADAGAIYDSCVAGDAHCLEAPDGFLVVQVKINPQTSAREFHCWFGASYGDEGAFFRTLPLVRRMARDLKCAAVTFDTTRQSWLRLAPKAGFVCRNIEFAMPVEAEH